MEVKMKKARCTQQVQHSEEDMRKGPWSVDEDTILVNHITKHGHAHWNSVARTSGLKRSGKSCRLRWLNYLRPDVRRGNITIQEQITILELYSRWGNRWSKIARHLPGRTDNEIKNYWRTRVIKQAKNLNCDVGSEQFKDALRYVLIPRLIERIQPQFGTYASAHISPSPSSPGLVHHQHRLIGSGPGTSLDSPPAELQARLDSEHFGYDDVSGLLSFNEDQVFEQGNWNATLSGSEDLMESLWDDENLWLIQQLCHDLEINHNFLA